MMLFMLMQEIIVSMVVREQILFLVEVETILFMVELLLMLGLKIALKIFKMFMVVQAMIISQEMETAIF